MIFTCLVCLKELPTPGDLAAHQRIHNKYPEQSGPGAHYGVQSGFFDDHASCAWNIFRGKEELARLMQEWKDLVKKHDEERARDQRLYWPDQVETFDRARRQGEQEFLDHQVRDVKEEIRVQEMRLMAVLREAGVMT